MSELYHLGHFFELLTGIYFGGFALLGHIEKGAHQNIFSKLKAREEQHRNCNVIAKEYFKLNSGTAWDGLWRFCRISFLQFWYFVLELTFRLPRMIAQFEFKKFSSTSEDHVLEKKYFPSFFFTGCFCFTMILMSAVQYENTQFNKCSANIDYFMLCYIASVFLFNIWSLIFLPKLVNRLDYLHLIFISIAITLVFVSISLLISWKPGGISSANWVLSESHKMWLYLSVILAALSPLLFIVVSSVFIVLSWETGILFTAIALRKFGQKEVDILLNQEHLITLASTENSNN